VVNGLVSPAFEGRFLGPLQRSPAGKHWFYQAESEKGRFIVIDGKMLGPWQNIFWPAWDRSGSKLAFSYSDGGQSFVCLDGKVSGPYAQAQLITLSDGRWIGFATWNKDNKISLQVDGKTLGPYDWVEPNLDWKSADGAQWKTRAYKKGASYLIENGTETRYDSLDLRVLPGGGTALTWGGVNNWRVNIDGLVLGPYDAPRLLALDDGSAWALEYGTLPADASEKYFVRLSNGQTLPVNAFYPVPGVSLFRDARGQAFTWSSGGRTEPLLAYRADASGVASKELYRTTQGNGGFTIVAEAASGPYADILMARASADGQHWAALVRKGENRYLAVVDGKESTETTLFGADGLALSPNGASWSYRGHPNKGTDQVDVRVINGAVSDKVLSPWPPEFSSDGRHISLRSLSLKDRSWTLSFDGKSYGPYKKDMQQHLFDMEAGHFVFGVEDKGAKLVVTDQGTFGPFKDFRIYSRAELPRDSETGPLLGFAGAKADGESFVYVFPGSAGGGSLLGPYAGMPNGPAALGQAYFAPDGSDWLLLAAKPGQQGQVLLRSGTETPVRGADLRTTAGGVPAFRFYLDESQRLELGGKTLGEWTWIGPWLVNRDGSQWAAEVQEGSGEKTRRFIVVNGAEQEGFRLESVMTPDGERWRWFVTAPSGAEAIQLSP
jgi:hypothetical protein